MPTARRRAAASSSNAAGEMENKNEIKKHRRAPGFSMRILFVLAMFAAGPCRVLASGERSLLQKTVSTIDPNSPIPDSPPDVVITEPQKPVTTTTTRTPATATTPTNSAAAEPPFDGVVPPAPRQQQQRTTPMVTTSKVYPTLAPAAAPAAPLLFAPAPAPSTWFPAPKKPDSAAAPSPAEARAKALAGVSVARRVTASASSLPCRLPLYVEGTLLTDCSYLNGSTSLSCYASGALGPQPCSQAAGTGEWEALSDLLARGGTALGDGGKGSVCTLPSMPQVGRSTECSPGFLCMPMEAGPLRNTRYGFCSGNGQAPGNAPRSSISSGGGAATGAGAVRVARARRTVDGRECRLPLWINGTLLTDCSEVEGMTACFPGKSAKKAVECAPVQEDWSTVALSTLLEAGTEAAGDGGRGAVCVLPLSKSQDPSDPMLPPRTGGAAPCSSDRVCVPTTAGPLVGTGVGYCAQRANMTMGSKIAAALGWGKNKPANGSTLASLASLPASPNASAIGAPLPVDPASATGIGSMLVAKRSSLGGAACRLPLIVPNRGSGRMGSSATVLLDCRVGLGGLNEPACYTRGLVDVAPCAPLVPTTATSPPGNSSSISSLQNAKKLGAATPLAELVALGKGADGGPGSICAAPSTLEVGYEGPKLSSSAVPPCKTGLVCREFQGAYGVCGPAPSPPPTVSPLIATGGEDSAAAAAAAASAAAVSQPRFPSDTAVRVARRASAAGMQCRLPIRYKGRLLTDCDGSLGDGGSTTGDKRCFVEGLNVTAICAPVASSAGAATESLDDLEARGGLGDGRAGALCHLLPPSSQGSSAPSSSGNNPVPVASCAPGLTCVEFASPPMAGGRFGWCKLPSQQKMLDNAMGTFAAAAAAASSVASRMNASSEGPLPAFARAPSMAPPEVAAQPQVKNNSTSALYPYAPRGVFGTPVPEGATANVGPYYCGPMCMGGSLLAVVLTASLMAWACVSLCRGGKDSSISNNNASPPPAGSMSSVPPQPPSRPRPATAPAPPVALSLRPTRYERFEDAPESETSAAVRPVRPGSAAVASSSTGATNPFASSYPAQPAPATWNQPLPPPPPPAWPGHGGR